MKDVVYYALAGLLVLASVPIYRSILSHRAQVDSVTSAPALSVDTPVPSSARSRRVVMTRNESEASDAIQAHRAKCVAGVVYRTADRVIEPWPGHVRCLVDDAGNFYGVAATGV
jgi:hypothetical protein